MNFLRLVIVLLVCLSVDADARVGQSTGTVSEVACAEIAYAPGTGSRSYFPPFTASTNVSLTGLGLLKCNAFELDCDMDITRLALDVVQSLPGVQCGAGIYQRTSATTAVSIARTAVLDCSDAVVIAASGGAAVGGTIREGTAHLFARTEYLSCGAFSIRNTSSVKYEAPRPIPLFLGLGQSSSYNADLASCSDCTTDKSAQFNAACIAVDDPWDCCTGEATGTCLGLPAQIFVLTPQFTHGPLLKLGR